MKYREEPIVTEYHKTLILEDEEADVVYKLLGSVSTPFLMEKYGFSEEQADLCYDLYSKMYDVKKH